MANSWLVFGSLAVADAPWLDGWQKLPDNPILSLSPPGNFDSHNILSPSVVKHDDQYFMYYSGGPSGPLTGEDYINYQLGLATSTDGVNFTKHGSPLLPLGRRDNFHVTPSLLRDDQGDLLIEDGKWQMVYVGNRADDVELAWSNDGINWQKDSASPIYPDAYAPSLLKVEDEYWMYYISKPSGRPWEVHAAKGPDLYSLEPVADNPVLSNSQAWERDNLFYPYVFREDNTWVMLYAGYWNDPAGGPQKTAIGAATSLDGINWTKNPDNPILTPTPGSTYDSVYTSSQSVLRDGDVYRMFYAGRVNNINKYFSINQATKPIGDGTQSSYQWNQDAIGLWSDAANWQGVNSGPPWYPSGGLSSASFGDVISGATTIVAQIGVSVGRIEFDSLHSYAIAGPGTIHLFNTNGNSAIDVLRGNHEFQSQVVLDDDLEINLADASSLSFENRLDLKGYNLTKTGSGQLTMNNVVNLDGGNLSATDGIVTGSAEILGSLSAVGEAVISPGNSPGKMHIGGSYQQGSQARLLMEIGGASAATYDVLQVASEAYLAGTLEIALINDYLPQPGDEYHILDLGTIVGSFDQVDLPTLPFGMKWDTSDLYVQGVVRVAVPEPDGIVLGTISTVLGLALSRGPWFSRQRSSTSQHIKSDCKLRKGI